MIEIKKLVAQNKIIPNDGRYHVTEALDEEFLYSLNLSFSFTNYLKTVLSSRMNIIQLKQETDRNGEDIISDRIEEIHKQTEESEWKDFYLQSEGQIEKYCDIILNKDLFAEEEVQNLVEGKDELFQKESFELFVMMEELRKLNQIMVKGSEVARTLKPIKWLGLQKELAELLISLQEKGWIKDFEYATLKVCFTETDSIDEHLKPSRKEQLVYTKEYKSKFEKISRN